MDSLAFPLTLLLVGDTGVNSVGLASLPGLRRRLVRIYVQRETKAALLAFDPAADTFQLADLGVGGFLGLRNSFVGDGFAETLFGFQILLSGVGDLLLGSLFGGGLLFGFIRPFVGLFLVDLGQFLRLQIRDAGQCLAIVLQRLA